MAAVFADLVAPAVCLCSYYVCVHLALRHRWNVQRGPLGVFARALVGNELEKAKGDDTPQAAKSDADAALASPFGSRGATLLFCVMGIQASYLSWGVMQERIMTVPYGAEGERFRSSKFLVLVNRLVALLIADVAIARARAPADATAPYRFSFCATSNLLSSVCQYEALKYVSFPTQVLAKSCKMVPVMLMGYVVSRRAYSSLDWLVAVAVTAGVCAFKRAEGAGAGAGAGGTEGTGAHTALLGYGLIAGYMAFDSFTSNWQEALFKAHPAVGPLRMMRQTNLFAAGVSACGLLLSGEAAGMPAFLARHPDCARHICAMSACSALGQLFIFFTIQRFGALAFATINTVRALFSVVLSFALFGHALNRGEAVGIGTVFLALFVQVVGKWRRGRGGARHGQNK